MKLARVVPIYKGSYTTDISNCRPVSLLPLLNKNFDRMVFSRLYNVLGKDKVITDEQFRFRKGKSTMGAIMQQMNYICENLDEGNIVILLFLYFGKDFDCFDHEILLTKLFLCRVHGMALEWFRSYLSLRKQYVSVNNSSSSNKPVTHGVPK